MPSSPRSRHVSTVASPTRFDDDGRVTYPGHIQYQTSESERERYPDLAEAVGHSRYTGPGSPRPERFPISGYFPDGQYFSVTGLRGPAIRSGDDAVIDRQHASHVIDHGEMSDAQAGRFMDWQNRSIYPTYETSGWEYSNCVHGHAEVGRSVFGWDVYPDQHARPQDLADQMGNLRVRNYNSDSDSDG
ncbi:type III effector [Ralstonia nicotianae]|uniref:Type III effector n=1 Tax=Ralstonia nicotianae TaxID=3037696 RepID=A0ABX7ZZR4_9RALS|nr:type III effector [Ralstonia solanacearum]QUP60214.1 type III effector [Ralstonia nicotianae]